MIEALIVSQILLGVVVIALAVVSFALARQIGVLHERIAPAGALSVNQRLKVGDAAPAMTVYAIDGRAIAVGEGKARSQLFFFLSPDCPVCKTLIPVLRSTARAERDWLDLVIASDGGDARRHAEFARGEGLDEFPYVLSEPLGRAFGVGKLPYAALVDERGRVASMGIVNSREHLESLFKAKELGVASLQDFAARRVRGVKERAKA
jgi:methylamine dehydrogenase accessory protein MauD